VEVDLPPSWMTDEHQRKGWGEFRVEVPWLKERDSTLVAIACYIRGRMTRGEMVGIPMLNLLRLCLGSMGAVPTGKLSAPVVEDDPNDALFRR
jgi:hypothetical protein